jgi:hypothetical protein
VSASCALPEWCPWLPAEMSTSVDTFAGALLPSFADDVNHYRPASPRRYFSSSCRMRSICCRFHSLWASPSEEGVSYQASSILRITDIGVARRLKANTFAWFQTRAPRAVSPSCTRAARTPGTLLATMFAPLPVQQQTMPSSASLAATASATRPHTSRIHHGGRHTSQPPQRLQPVFQAAAPACRTLGHTVPRPTP